MEPALDFGARRAPQRLREVLVFARHVVSVHQAQVLEERARAMRARLTPAEHVLWAELRGSRLGVGFRRQLVIGNFIVDFAAPKARLVVEVDGDYHEGRERKDARRDAALRGLGWRTLRFGNEEVAARLASVLARIRAACEP